MAAGTDSNLIALNRVNATNTFNLLKHFKIRYESLSEENANATNRSHPFPKAKALFQARQEIAKEPATRRPFYLDSVILVGDWE